MKNHYQRSEKEKTIYLTPACINTGRFKKRNTLDGYQMTCLCDSIRNSGMLQPITVREMKKGYELISGERRLRAAMLIGLKLIPCRVIAANDLEASFFYLIENLQRANLSPFEEAQAISNIINNFDITCTQLAVRIGLAPSTISKKLQLLKLSSAEQRLILDNGLSQRHARALLRLNEQSLREKTLKYIIENSLFASQTERYVDMLLSPQTKVMQSENLTTKKVFVMGDVRLFSNSLNRMLETVQMSGIDAASKMDETDDFIRYTVTISKKQPAQLPLQLKLG